MKEQLNETLDDLKALAVNVLSGYGIIPEDIQIVQGGGIKTVWKINTSDRTLCLKRLRQTYDKVLFSANAQIYVNNHGGNVPPVLLSKTGECVIQHNHQLFVLYGWLEGINLFFYSDEDLEAALKGLAVFHKASKGYKAPERARESSKFGQWPELYTSMKNRLEEWQYQAAAMPENPAHSTYLEYVPSMIDNANFALELIGKSKYNALATPESTLKVLNHQDFGEGNVISTPNGVIVLDLDSVTFDFPARDLRKIIGKRAEEAGTLDIRLLEKITGWYTSENPLTDDEMQFLYIDLIFPHWFHGLVKNQYLKNKYIKPSEIVETAEFEKNKLLALSKMIK